MMKRSIDRVDRGATVHPAQRTKVQRVDQQQQRKQVTSASASPNTSATRSHAPPSAMATESGAGTFSRAGSMCKPPAAPPASPHQLFAYCKQLVIAGEQQQALVALRKALRAAPGSLELTIFTAYAFYRCQHYKQAIAAFEQADKLFKSLTAPTAAEVTMIDQAQTFFDPFQRLPLELILRILEYFQQDVQHQVNPYVILELNSSLRHAALKTPSLWTNVVWSSKWPVKVTASLKTALPLVRHFKPCRLMLNFYLEHSRDLLQHIDFTDAPTMTSADLVDYAVALDKSQHSLVTLRVRPDVPLEPTGIEQHGLEPPVEVLSAFVYQMIQLKLMRIALESRRIKEIEFGVFFGGQLTRLLQAAESQGPKGTVPSLKRLSLHMASRQVPSPHPDEQIGQQSALRSRGLGTIPILSLLRGLEALKVLDRHGAHYDAMFFTILKPTLTDLDWAVSCEAKLQTEPVTLQFPRLERLKFKVLRQGPNRPDPPPASPLKIDWILPACKKLSMPYDRLDTVIAPLATDVTVVFCGPVHEPRLLQSFFLHQSARIKKLTLDFSPELWQSLGKTGLEATLRDAVIALANPPNSRNPHQGPDIISTASYLCHLEELSIVALHPHDSDEMVNVEATLTSPFCLRNFGWSRDMYESDGPRVAANLAEVLMRRSRKISELRRERVQQGGNGQRQQQSAFRRSGISNATSVDGVGKCGQDTMPWNLKRVRIENFYMAIESYETLRHLCKMGDIELTVTPDPVAMASQPFALDATGASRKHNLRERKVGGQ